MPILETLPWLFPMPGMPFLMPASVHAGLPLNALSPSPIHSRTHASCCNLLCHLLPPGAFLFVCVLLSLQLECKYLHHLRRDLNSLVHYCISSFQKGVRWIKDMQYVFTE